VPVEQLPPAVEPETEDAPVGTPERPQRSRSRRYLRRVGNAIIILGLLGLIYGALIYFWHDPATDLYNRWKQSQLGGQLQEEFASFRASVEMEIPPPLEPSQGDGQGETPPTDALEPAELQAITASLAKKLKAGLEEGQALGRIKIDALGLDAIFTNGTESGDLRRGPGHYENSSVPGLGGVTAIAGHRTTFGAPFRKIDKLKAGDDIVLEMPHGTFTYEVVEHEIVENDDWSILDERPYETLVLSACHPLFSASQRYIVYARLAKVTLPDGRGYRLGPGDEAMLA
jgi:sortase A